VGNGVGFNDHRCCSRQQVVWALPLRGSDIDLSSMIAFSSTGAASGLDLAGFFYTATVFGLPFLS